MRDRRRKISCVDLRYFQDLSRHMRPLRGPCLIYFTLFKNKRINRGWIIYILVGARGSTTDETILPIIIIHPLLIRLFLKKGLKKLDMTLLGVEYVERDPENSVDRRS